MMAFQRGGKEQRLRRFLLLLTRRGLTKIPVIINPIMAKTIIVSIIDFR
jgi:hypothetical protein